MNSKIALSALSVLTAMSLAAGGTFAFFSDTGTSTSNVFSTGTLDLKLTDVDQTDQDSVIASFGGTTMVPGVCLSPQTLSFKNSGTVAGNHLDLAVSNTNSTFASFLRIDALTYGATNLLPSLTGSEGNANGIKDMQDLAASTTVVTNLPLTDLLTDHTLSMTVCLDGSTDNSQQGASDTVTVSAFLNQGPHAGDGH